MRRFLATAAGLAAALLMPTAPAVAAESAICHVDYLPRGDSWSFTAEVIITNTGPDVLYGWTLKFSLPAGQLFRSGWEADFTVAGQDVTAHSLTYNSDVAPTKSVQVGFSAGGDVKGPRPAEFRINDHLCTTN